MHILTHHFQKKVDRMDHCPTKQIKKKILSQTNISIRAIGRTSFYGSNDQMLKLFLIYGIICKYLISLVKNCHDTTSMMF